MDSKKEHRTPGMPMYSKLGHAPLINKLDVENHTPSIMSYRNTINQKLEDTNPKLNTNTNPAEPEKSSNGWGKNAAYFGLGCLFIAYAGKVMNETNELSEKLQPLREKFEYAVQNAPYSIIDDGEVRTFDYHGKLEPLVKAKNQFAEDNGAYARRWDCGSDKTPKPSTPTPVRLNPLTWDDAVKISAVKPYMNKK